MDACFLSEDPFLPAFEFSPNYYSSSSSSFNASLESTAEENEVLKMSPSFPSETGAVTIGSGGSGSRDQFDSGHLVNNQNETCKIPGKTNKSDKPDRKTEVSEFFERYRTGNFSDVPVSKMRHIIPLLLMEVYSEKYGQYSCKVKGMWEKKPDDWPANVSYVDPNNNMKTKCANGKSAKPTKEVLMPMLNHLAKKYAQQKVGPSRSYPRQVEDTEYVDLRSRETSDSYNPYAELASRLGIKVDYVENQLKLTDYIPDLHKRLDAVSQCTSEFLLLRGHLLESFIDMLIERLELPWNWLEVLNMADERMESLLAGEFSKSVDIGGGGGKSWIKYHDTSIGSCTPGRSETPNEFTSSCNSLGSRTSNAPDMNIKIRGFPGDELCKFVEQRDVCDTPEAAVDIGCCGGEETKAYFKLESGHEDGIRLNLREIEADPDYNINVLYESLDQLTEGTSQLDTALLSDLFNASAEHQEGSSYWEMANAGVVQMSSISTNAKTQLPVSVAEALDTCDNGSESSFDNLERGGGTEGVTGPHDQGHQQSQLYDWHGEISSVISLFQWSPNLRGSFEQMSIETVEGRAPFGSFGQSPVPAAAASDVMLPKVVDAVNANKRTATPALIPVMVEEVEDFDDQVFSAPVTKRSRQSSDS